MPRRASLPQRPRDVRRGGGPYRLGKRLDARPYACGLRARRARPRPQRLRTEAALPDGRRQPPHRGAGVREGRRHADGHADRGARVRQADGRASQERRHRRDPPRLDFLQPRRTVVRGPHMAAEADARSVHTSKNCISCFE